MAFEKLPNSGQSYRLVSSQGFAVKGVVTISGKMELFWALCRGGVDVCQWSLMQRLPSGDGEGAWRWKMLWRASRGSLRDPTATLRYSSGELSIVAVLRINVESWGNRYREGTVESGLQLRSLFTGQHWRDASGTQQSAETLVAPSRSLPQ
jgi:hypothetical protein